MLNYSNDDPRLKQLNMPMGNSQTEMPGDIAGQLRAALQAANVDPQAVSSMTWPQVLQALQQRGGAGAAAKYQQGVAPGALNPDVMRIIQQQSGGQTTPSQFLALPTGGVAQRASQYGARG